MADPAKCYAKAEELLRLAGRCASLEERTAFLELSAGWQELGMLAEQMRAKPTPSGQAVIPFPDDVLKPRE
jgi:hypothetical protein